jgi:putative N-acetyltransferase (TIGR04045 family)
MVTRSRPQPDTDLEVRLARTPEELAGHFRVREEVFVEEQGLFNGTDRDHWDEAALHIVAVSGGEVLGAVRLYPLDEAGLWQGDRLAVSSRARQLRAGGTLVRCAVRTAGALGGHLMIARIQAPIVPLFRFLGWERVGGLIEYRGVPHQRMTIPLSGAEPAFAEEAYSWALGAGGDPSVAAGQGLPA